MTDLETFMTVSKCHENNSHFSRCLFPPRQGVIQDELLPTVVKQPLRIIYGLDQFVT